MEKNIAISVTSLSKTFKHGFFSRKKLKVLDEISLTVKKGEVFGLIGINGAGKTTLLKSLLSIVKPDNGYVEILGCPPEDRTVRMKWGYMPEKFIVPSFYSPFRFIEGVALMKKVNNPEKEALKILERVGLQTEALRKMKGFSKGMSQRVGLAASLVGSPEILFLDEPSDGIDPLGRTMIREIITEEKKRGATIFLNSHLLSEVERVCDEVAIMKNGNIVAVGDIDFLSNKTNNVWRVRFERTEALSILPGFDFSKKEGEEDWTFNGSAENLNITLTELLKNGLRITSLHNDSKDLEEIFKKIIRE